ncbi:MAG: sulfotransferase [Nitrococcus sp.]|nr:sulfotransferase [Nitrococcus sp.]
MNAYRLYSLAETDFFGTAAGGGLGAVGCRLGLARSPAKYGPAFDRLRELLGPFSLLAYRNPTTRRFGKLVASFTTVLDQAASEAGEVGWLEKTPGHYRHLPLIRRFVPGASVVHVIRWGPDVVASLRDRALRYAKFERQAEFHYGVRLWNRALSAALRDARRYAASVVLYEDFANYPKALLQALGRELGLAERRAGEPGGDYAIYAEEERWKHAVDGSVRPAASKFSEVFSQRERDWVERSLSLMAYRRLVERATRPANVWLDRRNQVY